MKGFENLGPAELDAVQTIVFRFVHGELLDVSSEFQPSFDREIAGLRKELDSGGLRDFKSSDGKLLPNASFSHRAATSLARCESQDIGNRLGLSLQRS
jgi:hypothetical protein